MASESFIEYVHAACEAAWRAAAVLEEYRPRLQTREKDRFDLVTDADLASQRAIRTFLAERFPQHGFLGEEEGAGTARPGPDAPPTWIVDPIDGTTNYVHDFPFYCISIGLQAGGDLAIGVVLDPVRKELFRAAKGQGAWLNDRRLRVSRIATLGEALVSTGFPANPAHQKMSLDWWRYFSARVQSLRRTGSTALNIVYVAAGRFDAYYGFDNHVWDVAAGVVIAREAGALVTNADGSAYDPHTADAVVTNDLVHPAMLQSLRDGPV